MDAALSSVYIIPALGPKVYEAWYILLASIISTLISFPQEDITTLTARMKILAHVNRTSFGSYRTYK